MSEMFPRLAWEDLLAQAEDYDAVVVPYETLAQVKQRMDRLDALLQKHGLEEGLDLLWEIRNILAEC